MKTKLVIIGFFLVSIAVVSCKLEPSDNGDLDGFWHMERIDTLKTGGSKYLAQERYFWSFQKHLMILTDKNGGENEYILRFEHRDNQLILSDPFIYDRPKGDVKVEDGTMMKSFGVNKLKEVFAVETLTNNQMVLASDTLRIFFTKF